MSDATRSDSLLATKLFAPPPAPALVPRPRLSARLDEGWRMGRKLTLAVAPPGWGKSTTLSAWLSDGGRAAGSDRPAVAWVALDAGDNDPARFWSYVFSALSPTYPAVAGPLLALLRSSPPPPIETTLTTLVNALAAPDAPRAILVLDDYHTITAQPIHAALAFLIDQLPPALHLAIASRADPPLPLGRLRARGALTELRAADLRFSAGEAAAFLNETMGLALTAGDVAALEARTEGWIAGLQLAALAMRDRADLAGFIAGFTGSHRFVVDYLAEEVLERQPPEIQTFLRDTAVLDRLCAPLCAAVLAGDGAAADAQTAQALLERLERANLFLIPLDDERRWYRYHHLFADVLRARGRQADPARLPALCRRAARWCAANAPDGDAELLTDAVHYALQAGDLAFAADLVEARALPLLWTHGDVAAVRRWFAMLPESLIAGRVLLCVISSQVAFIGGDLAELHRRVDQARRALAALAEPPAEWVAGVAGLEGWVAILKGEFARGQALLEQALPAMPAPSLNRSLLLHALGEFYLRGGQHAPAGPLFAEVAAASQAEGFPILAISGMSGLTRCRIFDGRLADAAAICREGLLLADRLGVGWAVTVANLHWMLGMVSYAWDDPAATARHTRRALEISRLGHYEWLTMAATLTLALALLALGEEAAAVAALDESEQIAARLRQPRTLAQIAAVRRLWRLPPGPVVGLPDADLLRRALDLDLAAASDPVFAVEPEYYAPLRALLGDPGERAAARDLLGRLLDVEEAAGRVSRVAALHALRADHDVAVGPGAHIGAPLHRGAVPALAEPLTEREREVLRLVAAGASNREIAAQLVVSLGTVKKHTNNIFGKLGAQSRTQAIVKARALGLLE